LTEHGAEIEALQRVLSLDPNNIQARISVGQLMLNQGKMDEAIREFQQVVRSPYAPLEAQMLLGSIRIAKARVVKASEEEWNDIGEYVRKFRERYRTATEPALLGVELLTTRKRYDDAVKLLLAERGRRPNDARLWVRLAEVKELALGFQAAQETLDEGQAILGDLVDLRLARAKLWSHSLSLQKADVMKSLESGVDSFAEADQVRLLYGLADLYSGVQETASVKRMYQVIAARFPTDVPIRTALAQLALSEKDEALYMAMKTQIAALEGEHPRTLPLLEVEHTLAFAKNPSEDKLLRDAKTQVEGMLKVSPTRADATQVLGRIAEAQGDFATARQLYAKAYDLDRTNLNHLKQHARFLWRTNQDVAAVKLMTDLYIDPRVSPEQFRQIFESVMTLLPEKAYGKAMVWVQKFFTEDAPSLVWVADMLWERKKADEAIALYQAARKLDPNLADPYTHLVCRLCESKRLDEMEVVVEEARAGLTSQAFYFLCAHTSDLVRERLQQEWLPKLADAEQRRNLAQATLTLHLSQNQRKSAMHVLQTVADATESRPEDVAWAKRNLSLLQAIDGTPEERRQALRYLAETKPGKQTIEERRAQVAILVLASRQLDSVERKIVLKDAIESLNEILQTPKVATTKDLYHLAQLQRIAGNPKGYQESLLKLMQQEPANISYLTAYVDDLLLGNQLDTAMPHVTRLQEQFAGDFRAVSVIARYYQMKYAPERVLDVCESYIRGVEPGSNEAMLRVRRIADLLEQLIQTGGIDHPSTMALVPAAIEKYQACLRSYPDGIVALVALQAMSGQTSAVFDQLTRLKPTMSKRVLTSAGLATLRNGQATERQYQTVAGWINEALAEQPQSLAIRLSMAEYHTLHQNFADAEAAYLDVLKIDPNNVMALNNLAWILSPKADNAPQALEYVQRAIAISGHTGELLDTRARILIATGKYDRAVEDLTEALNQSQTSLRYFHLSMVKLKQSQNEEALAAFRQAKLYGISARSIHPNDLPAYKMLATQVGQ